MTRSPSNQKKFCRYFGRTLRIILFCLNGVAWTVGMLCILGSFLIGFYSKTIKFSWIFDLYDLSLTTPCTIMFYYGVLLGITTISGCFAGSGGRWWCTGLYCILLIGLAIFDYFWGIRVFFKRTSLMDFLETIESSMYQYAFQNATFGIYPRQVQEYWDHIQRQSHCCGMYQWRDWSDTPIGKTLDLPSSCCNEMYGSIDCGKYLGQHPDSADHQVMDIVHTKGCLKAYPRRFIWAFFEASVLGIILAIVLLISFLLSLMLFFIVICCCYRPGKPITDPSLDQSRRRRKSGRGRHHHRPSHARPHSRLRRQSHVAGQEQRLSDPSNPVTYDQFGRRRISIPSGQFEIEIEQEPQKELEIIV